MQQPLPSVRESPVHVLVVDDDDEIQSLLARYLTSQAFRVTTAGDGAAMLAVLHEQVVDLVLLDLGLPGDDGLTLLRQFRDTWPGPVIVVSGRGESVERILGLELGADDYVTKPFELRELLARIRSVLRRTQAHAAGKPSASSDRLRFEGFCLEPASRRLFDGDGGEIALTSGEFDLLHTLLKRPNQVLSRDQLMTALHGRDAGPYDRSIDVQVGRLRRKIEADPGNPVVIRSVRGAGYMLATAVTAG